MLLSRPPLLLLNGLDPVDAYRKAREEFAKILLADPVIDPLDRRIVFDLDENCWHVCFKEGKRAHDPFKRLPRDKFRFDRAERIPWIRVALEHREETQIRESPVAHESGRQSYTLWIPADPKPGTGRRWIRLPTRPGGPSG